LQFKHFDKTAADNRAVSSSWFSGTAVEIRQFKKRDSNTM
jgi:hypothetical protein